MLPQNVYWVYSRRSLLQSCAARDWKRRPHSVLGKVDTTSDQVETILHLYNSLLPTDLLPNTAMIAEHFGGASSKPDQKPVID